MADCEWCGGDIDNDHRDGSCNRCWELYDRIRADLKIALAMVAYRTAQRAKLRLPKPRPSPLDKKRIRYTY